jgi:hypothetical protein
MEIKIAGITFQMQDKEPEQMNGLVGMAIFNTQEMWINSSSTQQTKIIARWHETIHMLDRTYGTKFTEEQVTIFTHALVALLRDNEGIVDQINND